MWHAAVLDTRLYAKLQAKLHITLHHRPAGACVEENDARTMRRQTMMTLYRQFFQTEPIGIEWDDQNKVVTTVETEENQEEETLMASTEPTQESASDTISSLQSALNNVVAEQKQTPIADTEPTGNTDKPTTQTVIAPQATLNNDSEQQRQTSMASTEPTDSTTTTTVKPLESAPDNSQEHKKPGVSTGSTDKTIANPTVNAPETVPTISVRLNRLDGEDLWYRIKIHTPLRKLIETACRQLKIDQSDMRFIFDTVRIYDETPAMLNMEDNDTIDMRVERSGC